MWFDTELALDHLSSLAVLAILAWGYALVRQRGVTRQLSPVALGLGFGLVAVLQMNAAFQPVAGFLIDLRLVPVGLAGAYLGRPGLVACLVIALAGRYQIGGVGAHADMASICIAGFAGFAWSRWMRMREVRGIGPMVVLALATALGFLPALLLPTALMTWFVIEALPILLLLHVLSVLPLAVLLERVRHSGVSEIAATFAAEGGAPRRSDRSRVLPPALAGGTSSTHRADPPPRCEARLRLRRGVR